MPQSDPSNEVTVLPGNLKHGLRAESIVIPSESEADWLQHLDETTDAFNPQTAVERALAFRIAQLLWRIRRAARAETGTINAREAEDIRIEQLEIERYGHPTSQRRVAALPNRDTMDAVIRYEAHINRMLFQTMHELEAMQGSRSGKTTPLARIQIHESPPNPP